MTKMGDAKRAAKTANAKFEKAVESTVTAGLIDVVTHGHSVVYKGVRAVWAANQANKADAKVTELRRKRKNKINGALTVLGFLGSLGGNKR